MKKGPINKGTRKARGRSGKGDGMRNEINDAALVLGLPATLSVSTLLAGACYMPTPIPGPPRQPLPPAWQHSHLLGPKGDRLAASQERPLQMLTGYEQEELYLDEIDSLEQACAKTDATRERHST